jgi:uncharacterized protein YndB with AHSA1/START domain
MNKAANTLEFRIERTIAASPAEVFDAWLNPKIPGTPWYEADKLIFNPKLDGLWYWLIRGTPHFGRFTELQRPDRIQHTWMSPNTLGQESLVTLTFKKQGQESLMTLVHSGLPDNEPARGHEKGWNYFLDRFVKESGDALRTGK